ncbi:MAG: hypothetical protein PF692_08595 [Kiritimatiellae bacterium]|jgi:hypothetical protein|nr:hypothetical protein [Kiritimatiellia bacterium]
MTVGGGAADNINNPYDDDTWKDINGMKFGDFVFFTDTSPSKNRTAAHELLHFAGLQDSGPPGNNTANIMYYAGSSTKYFSGYFKVERVVTGKGKSYSPKQYELQWETIAR